jgi:hypothetical protein
MTALTATSGASNASVSEAKVPKMRVQFDLGSRSVERLNALKMKTEASSYAVVVKYALRLYEALIEEAEQGKQFLVRYENGVVSPYRLFL